MMALTMAMAMLGVAAAGVMWSGFALSILWGWFFVPALGAPALSVPNAIRLPSAGGRAQPLWKASEVIAWATKYQEGADGRSGRPRKAA